MSFRRHHADYCVDSGADYRPLEAFSSPESRVADLFWFSLLLKMLASACVVAVAAAAVERVGPIFGALIATLPVSAGPAYVFLAMDHDDAFIAASALTSMVAAGSNAAFIAVYVFAAQSWSMPASVGAAVAAWLVSVLLAGQVGWTGPVLLVASLAAFGGTFLLIRPLLSVRAGEPPPSRWFEPVLRGTLVMLLVAAVVLSGRALGPQAAGIAALVPLIFISLSIILHARIGGRATAAVVGNSTLGLMGL